MSGGDGRNPWPGNSDFGKLWRGGFDAGRSYAVAKMLPTIQALSTLRKDEDER